jgi:ABC-2 type transport system permease protein
VIRALWSGFVMHFRMLSRGGFELSGVTVWPLVYTTLGYFMYSAGGRDPATLFYVSLGSTMMAIWSMIGVESGGAIQRQRRHQVLELLVAAPQPFWVVLLPIMLAATAMGIYAFAGTIAFGRLVFGIPVTVEHPLLFAVALPVAIVSISMLGLVFASVLVRYRQAQMLTNSLEYPVWLLAGMLMPLSLLPGWVHPISWILAPMWGMRAVRDAALGGPALPAIGMCVALSAAYAAIALLALANFERLARRRATLSLT